MLSYNNKKEPIIEQSNSELATFCQKITQSFLSTRLFVSKFNNNYKENSKPQVLFLCVYGDERN